MAFISCNNGDLTKTFITEAEIIDRFVGNQLWNWGCASTGALGNNSTINRSSPVQTVSTGTNWKQVALGTIHSSAIKTDGTLWLWGSSSDGILGNNDASINRSSPVQTVSTGTNWKQVALGSRQGSAIKTDGTLWLWGSGSCGALGTNSTINRSSPVQTVSTGNNWKEVSMSKCGIHSFAATIKTDGTLWLWGLGTCGRLGNNSTINQSSPVQTVSQENNWKQVSAGGAFASAIKTDGTLWLWGNNSFGELGTNTTTVHSSPVQTVSAGNNWKQIALSCAHSSAIKTDGTLWLWGDNCRGTLGNSSTINRSSPVQTITTGTNWKQVSAEGDSGPISAAIKTDGTLWLWGFGGGPTRLGNNSSISHSSPVQTVTTGTNWKQVSVGLVSVGAVTFTEF